MTNHHPNYLGHNEYITDKSGRPYQYFHYSAFGEVLVQRDANYGSFQTSYTFNAKEFDQETGLGYYGARYYNPTFSVWLGVDPLAGSDPDKNPYHFVRNNPVMLVDPNGLTSYELDENGYRKKVDNNIYVRNEKGETRQLKNNEKPKDGEVAVDRYIGTNEEGEKQEIYFYGKMVIQEKEIAYENNNGIKTSSKYDQYAAGSHEDAIQFMEFARDVTKVEFGYALTEISEEKIRAYQIGTLHDGGATTVLYQGKLVYDLHLNPGLISRQDAYSAFRKNNVDTFFEALTDMGYITYSPLMPGDVLSPLSHGKPKVQSSFNP